MIFNTSNPDTSLPRLNHLAVAFILAALLGLSACSSPIKQDRTQPHNTSLFPGNSKLSKLQQELSRHFQRWQYTPYKLGGTSRQGIDCSGFVHVTYRNVFHKKIPRSTKLQGQQGQAVSRKYLKLGDLVFFQTGRRQQHVGIYIGNNRFIHASTSRGVMLSKLSSPYWSKHYRNAKRILNI